MLKRIGKLVFPFMSLMVFLSPHSVSAKDYGWFGSVSFGALLLRGNSEVSNLGGSIKERYESKQWKHAISANMLHNATDNKVSAERYEAEYKLLYKFYPHIDLFASLRALTDEFAGYEEQYFQTVGYRHTLVEGLFDTFAFEVGLGFSQQTLVGGGREFRNVLRVGYDYEHEFFNGNKFSTDLLSLIGEENSNTVANIALKTKLVGAIGLEVSMKVSHNSIAIEEKRPTDTSTVVALVYDF